MSTSSSNLLQTLLKENSDLTERLSSVSQESATFKSRLAILEKQLQRKQSELAKVTTETENQPVSDPVCHHRVSTGTETIQAGSKFRGCILRKPIMSQWCDKGCPNSRHLRMHPSVHGFDGWVWCIFSSPPYPKIQYSWMRHFCFCNDGEWSGTGVQF